MCRWDLLALADAPESPLHHVHPLVYRVRRRVAADEGPVQLARQHYAAASRFVREYLDVSDVQRRGFVLGELAQEEVA